MLRDLARLHAGSRITYDFLAAQYITHHAFDWSDNPFTSGDFAIFSPGNLVTCTLTSFVPLRTAGCTLREKPRVYAMRRIRSKTL